MIYTWSKFNYDQTITTSNQYIPFKEPTEDNVEVNAVIPAGSYSLGEFAAAIEDAMNAVGQLVYAVALDRASNRLTISAGAHFNLLIATGSTTSTAFDTMGFTQVADQTGASTYTGAGACGTEYVPQFRLQSYLPPENWVESVDATVNKSADGRVEVVRFGLEQKIEMEIKFITNLPMDGTAIKNNPTGLQDARDFFGYISQKKKFEFVPDILNPDTYYKVILENTPGESKGTGFKLKELFGQDLPDVYETGVITLRVIA